MGRPDTWAPGSVSGPHKLSQFRKPCSILTMCDASEEIENDGLFGGANSGTQRRTYVGYYHSGFTNVLFLDGHVEPVKYPVTASMCDAGAVYID